MDTEQIKVLLGKRIKQLRQSMKLTQFALGEKVNIDQRQIAYIEGGKCFPSLKTLNNLSIVFQIELKDLFDYKHLMKQENIKTKISQKLSKMDNKRLTIYYQLMNLIDNYI